MSACSRVSGFINSNIHVYTWSRSTLVVVTPTGARDESRDTSDVIPGVGEDIDLAIGNL